MLVFSLLRQYWYYLAAINNVVNLKFHFLATESFKIVFCLIQRIYNDSLVLFIFVILIIYKILSVVTVFLVIPNQLPINKIPLFTFQQNYDISKPEPHKLITISNKAIQQRHYQTDEVVDRKIVPSLTDGQLLSLALTQEFKEFVEGEVQKPAATIASKPRRESEDSSYFSDASHASPYSCPATPPTLAKEAFCKSLDKDVKTREWVKVNTMGDEELYGVDDDGKR